MQLPNKREFGWKLKTLDSAHTEVNTLPTGQIELIIKHDLIKGISVEMLIWWFENFANTTITKDGKEYTAYDLWHPYDHISVSPDKPKKKIEEGDFITINECFNRNPKFYLKESAQVYYFKKDGLGLKAKKLGKTIMTLLHKFENVDGGVKYNSRMLLGFEKGLLKPIVNYFIIPKIFGKEKANAWLLHNIEEVGCFEYFLKDLYEKRESGRHIELN